MTDAVLLAGGRARRYGADKVLAEVGGRTLLEAALDAVASARHVVAVGPPREVRPPREVHWVREDPPFGGPVAGLAAGLAALPDPADDVLLLATDLPHADRLVAALLATPAVTDARVVTDPDGRAQWTASLLRREPLDRALTALGQPDAASLRALFSHLEWEQVPVPAADAWDVDTPDDLRRSP